MKVPYCFRMTEGGGGYLQIQQNVFFFIARSPPATTAESEEFGNKSDQSCIKMSAFKARGGRRNNELRAPHVWKLFRNDLNSIHAS